MKIRKMNAHRARLSYEKPTGYGRKSKAGRRVLLMWNTKGRGVRGHRLADARFKLHPYQLRVFEILRKKGDVARCMLQSMRAAIHPHLRLPDPVPDDSIPLARSRVYRPSAEDAR